MSVYSNNSLLVILWCPLVGGMRLIGTIVGTVIFAGSRHQDDAQHCPVHAFISGIMSRVSTAVWQAQFPACVLANACCLAHAPQEAKIFPVSKLLMK